MEAGVDHHHVLHMPAGQRFLRAVVLFHGRAARLPGAVERAHNHRVHVPISSRRQPCVLHVAPRQTENAHRRIRYRNGRVTRPHHRAHENLQRHGQSPVLYCTHHRVHYVRVFRSIGHASIAVEYLRRNFPDGRQRYVPHPS